jgi:hypothetical protein
MDKSTSCWMEGVMGPRVSIRYIVGSFLSLPLGFMNRDRTGAECLISRGEFAGTIGERIFELSYNVSFVVRNCLEVEYS